MKRKLVECHFIIPIRKDTDRKLHQPISWKLLSNELRNTFPKGHSGPEILYKDVETVKGEYEEDFTKRIVSDQSRRYTIAIPIKETEKLRKLLSKAANTFDQKAIYLSITGRVEFIEPDSDGRGLIDIQQQEADGL